MASAGNKQKSLPPKKAILPQAYFASLAYHDIFDYPMTMGELNKWKLGMVLDTSNLDKARKIGKYFIFEGKKNTLPKRLKREKASLKKMGIAKKGADILATLPTVKMVGVTGALAMGNADPYSDVDLIIICSSGTLWTTRLFTTLILDLLKIPRRSYGLKNQKDKLCLNIWLDETELSWDKNDRNLYTAHEIAQIVPLVNKDKTYEKFIYKNRWAKVFWPNAIKVPKSLPSSRESVPPFIIFEPFARSFQLWYMRNKITREVVTPTKAIFHPRDWGKIVLQKLNS
jgi:D-beta-D-heptose 7-phosphate kinase/D-beta-D-heptose 1-phosphate adenosyltransferase